MQAYVIEELHGGQWKRGARIFWTRTEAEQHGQSRYRLQSVKAIRLIPTQINLADAFDLERAEVTR